MRPIASTEVPALFDERVIVLTAEIDEAALALITPGEAELVARAVDKRKREFATARVLAHEAMARVSGPGVTRRVLELLNAPDRSPIWPEGITGSISHCDTRAIVAVAERAHVGTIGIDVEHRDELKRELWRSVFLRQEIDALDARFESDVRGRMALALFSAKEALYKAQYPCSTRFMSFSELHVELVPDAGSPARGAVICTFQNDVPPFVRGTVARGRYRLDAFAGDEVVTAVRIEPELAHTA
ncbi:MAG: 4'-phosphopantetheinyl transferase superfamily protein [Myxococcota bacterium]|nr:4'-phosphopantetheinyl transferase superfamily protein [Myxococcota bacterium]